MVIIKIFRCHVTAAGNCNFAVYNKSLVMHALINAAKVYGNIKQALMERRADRVLRVVYVNIDVGMFCQCE